MSRQMTPEAQTRVDTFITAHIAEMTAAVASGATVELSIWTYLTNSENQLIGLMNGTPPAPDAPGSIEWSWALYTLNDQNIIGATLYGILKTLGMPDSNISEANWDAWYTTFQGNGVLFGDGSLVATASFAIMDAGWVIAPIHFFYYYLASSSIHPANFSPAATTIPSTQASLDVALFGDWGTGGYSDGTLPSSPSQIIGKAIANAAPDVAIHLGDVYYAGTDNGLIFNGEEQSNLVNCWPNGANGGAALGNFTMNSNHEMYDGANGLFDVALATSNTTLFSKQNGSTVFTITYGDWLIIGLDSAYNAEQMYMNGRITDATQIALLKQAGASGQKILLLTHHVGISEVGDEQQQLWTDVVTALGKAPDHWYWGHAHNAMVYSSSAVSGSSNCRCLGNAAIPIGNASWFAGNSKITFYTSKLVTASYPTFANPLRVQNGYAMLTLTPTGGITENWYNMDGTLAWTSNS